ncbi:MAG: cobalt ECF transporter T component CbiQ [Verrucomicrobiia bacterium]
MHHEFLDRYSRLDSPVHRLPAALKFVLALIFVFVTVALPLAAREWFIGLFAMLVAIAALSRIPWLFLLKRLLFLEPFVLGVAVLTLFQPNGIRVFATIFVRSTLCLLTMVLLSNTTPFATILQVLRRVRVPALFVTTLALMYRYLFVLVDEAERMHRARASRTFTPKTSGNHAHRIHLWQMLGTVIGQLFVRSTERAERIYAAMLARGWR